MAAIPLSLKREWISSWLSSNNNLKRYELPKRILLAYFFSDQINFKRISKRNGEERCIVRIVEGDEDDDDSDALPVLSLNRELLSQAGINTRGGFALTRQSQYLSSN